MFIVDTVRNLQFISAVLRKGENESAGSVNVVNSVTGRTSWILPCCVPDDWTRQFTLDYPAQSIGRIYFLPLLRFVHSCEHRSQSEELLTTDSI